MKSLNLTSVFGEVDRLKEENTRLEKICHDRTREIDLMRHQVKRMIYSPLFFSCVILNV